MEGNIIHKFTTTKRALSRGKLIQVHDKKGNLNQPLHIAGHTLSPSSCTHFFLFNLKVIIEGHIMTYCLSTAGVILLEYYQLTDAI